MTGYNELRGLTQNPGATLAQREVPIVFFEDFLRTGIALDAALSVESDPAGYFTENADRGFWLFSGDTKTVPADWPTAIDSHDGGAIAVKSGGSTGNQSSAQINGEHFLMEVTGNADRELYFECRFRVTNISCDMFLGLATNSVDPHAEIDAGTSGLGHVGFTLSGDADLEASWGIATDRRIDTGFNVVAATWHTVAWKFNGDATLNFYADGKRIYRSFANFPLGSVMSPTFCIESNGVAETLNIDYILVVADRE